MAPLNHKQKAFAHFYVKGDETTRGNATASAIAAKYSPRTAHSSGPRMLEHVGVAALIADLEAKAFKTIARTADHVLEELARLGFSDITAIYNDEKCSHCNASVGTLKHPKDMPVEIRRAIKSVEFEELFEGASGEKFVHGRIVKITLHSKEKGLELLGKNLKLFTDKFEHEVGDTLADILAAARAPEGEE